MPARQPPRRFPRQEPVSYGPAPIAVADLAAAADSITVTSVGYAPTLAETAAAFEGIQTVSSSALPTHNGAEGGTNGTTVTAALTGGISGNQFDGVSVVSGGTLIFSNTHAAHGSLAYGIATGVTAGAVELKWNFATGQPVLYYRLYVYMTSNSAAIRPFEPRTGTGGTGAGPSLLITGVGALQMQDATFSTPSGATFTTHVPLNQWVRLEGFFTADPSAGQMSCSLYTSMDSTIPVETRTVSGVNTGNGGSIFSAAWFGTMASVANVPMFWLDDLALSATGPIGPAAGQVTPFIPVATPAFIRSQMPRMHLQDLITGRWQHRDVQGVTSPLITWTLNGPGTFTCTMDPPRFDAMDGTGNPLIFLWRTACYLEENGDIKFGGICTGQQGQGPQWSPTFTEFSGYANGMPYEGDTYSQTQLDALDAVRFIWTWLQAQPGGNIGLQLDTTKSGVLLGDQPGQAASTTVTTAPKPGDKTVTVSDASGFLKGMSVQLGEGEDPPYTISAISGNTITLSPAVRDFTHHANAPFVQLNPLVPFELDWWNSTDLGQEIQSIQQEAVFDFFEQHTWNGPDRTDVVHQLHFGVPRIGQRRLNLRFAEGENITVSSQVTQDGTAFANNVVGLGSGQGSTQIRAQASQVGAQLRRTFVYTDQTVTTVARMQAKAQKVLASMLAVDTPNQVTVMNHTNAPFGTFAVGDDILITLVSGWRDTQIWCRIVQMTQDPTTNLMNLTLMRSDSFTYLAESGQDGTI